MTLSIIDCNGLLDDELRRLTERRFLFALSRFDSRIRQTEVAITTDADAQPDPSTECRVTVVLKHSQIVSLSERDADLAKCVSRVAERTGRAIGRYLDQARLFGQQSSIPLDTTMIT